MTDPWRLVYQIAGAVGVDPGPLTIRELVDMSEGKSRSLWAHTSAQLAMLANVNRRKGQRAIRPEELDPWHQAKKKRRQLTAANIGELWEWLPAAERKKLVARRRRERARRMKKKEPKA